MQSSRRLEREAQRNVELIWLTGRLAPDHKTIADFRRENGSAIQAACAQFVVLCRQLGLFGTALVAMDGSKFKAVNTRDRNFIAYKVKRRIEQVAEHIASYLQDLDTADRHEDRAAARPDGDAEGQGGRSSGFEIGSAEDLLVRQNIGRSAKNHLLKDWHAMANLHIADARRIGEQVLMLDQE